MRIDGGRPLTMCAMYLRLTRDAELVLFTVAAANSRRASPRSRASEVKAAVGEFRAGAPESAAQRDPRAIDLGAASAWITPFRKAVELGVLRIVPVVSARNRGATRQRARGKTPEHWRGIVRHATEQSGRTCCPKS